MISLNKDLVLLLHRVMVYSVSIILYVKPRFICPFYIIMNLLGSFLSAFFFPPPLQVLGLKVFQKFLSVRPCLHYPVYINALSKFCHPAMHLFEKLISF